MLYTRHELRRTIIMVDNRNFENTSSSGQSVRAGSAHASSRIEQARHVVTDAARRVRHRAGDAVHATTEKATHAIDQQKGQIASRLSRIATSMRDAGQCFSEN